MDPALCELLRDSRGPDDQEIEAIIRLDQPTVDVAGVRIVSRFGPVATCRLAKCDVVRVHGDPKVRSLKWSRPLGAERDAEAESPPRPLPLQPIATDQRRPPDLRLTGAGVLVGVVDWGCDPDAPSLKHPDGTTRLLALWDQRSGGPGPAPPPYGYGTVYTAAQIDAALRSADPYDTLGYHPAEADRTKRGTHGMHVLDIAAGNGRGGGPIGVAPEADVAFVHLGQQDTGGLANLGDSARILEAIDFIFRLAGDRPCVINLSVGRHGGPHDGCTLSEIALDHALSAAPNRCVVQSAGNYYGKSVHASGRLRPGERRTLSVLIHEDDRTANELEVWYDGADELDVEVVAPTGGRTGQLGLGGCADLVVDGQIVGRLYHRASDPNNHDNHVDLFLYPGAPAGAWRVTLAARRVGSGAFHAWLERDDACPTCQSRFLVADSDDACTTGTIANGHLPIVVGAYDPHAPGRGIGRFSSAGPTRDGRDKPDIVGPGVQILAARSAPEGSDRSPGLLVRKSGTSMAAPHVTGAAALCLQGAPAPLTARQVRSLVLGTTTGASDDVSSRFGHGYLDQTRLEAAVAALGRPRARAATPQGRNDPKEPAMSNGNALQSARNQLTNLVFFARHPERQGRKLAPDEANYRALSREWLQIRDTIIAPVLGGGTARPAANAPAPSASPAPAGPLAAVGTPLPWGQTRNRFGLAATIDALTWIRQEWAQRHPEVEFRVRDISRQGGGRLAPHQSHRAGLDADVHLVVAGKRIGVGDADYEQHRPLVQELVDLIRSNPVLAVKTIGFLDPQVRGVDQWPRHTRHLHVRFCRPDAARAEVDLDKVYDAGEAKPRYDCPPGSATASAGEEAFPFGPIPPVGAPGGRTPPDRVVFLPGLLGSVLVDGGLSRDEAADICRDNLGIIRRIGLKLKASDLYPCSGNKRPEALWGDLGMLHWFFAPKAWAKRMRSGNGIDQPGDVKVGGLVDVEGSFEGKRFEFKPYTGFVKALQDAGMDVLVFPYDWRLSVPHNAKLLETAVLTKWFGGTGPKPGRPLDQAERINFIGHSLGGLVARGFVESTPRGRELTRRLITVGTPHVGTPQAYLYFVGRSVPFEGDAVPDGLPKVPRALQGSTIRSMASVVELLPTRNFVESGGQPVFNVDLYKQEKHRDRGGKPVGELLFQFRSRLVLEKTELLDPWLEKGKVDYHFVATSGYSTAAGYDLKDKSIKVTRDGDGTVPLWSAHPLPASSGRVRQKLLPKGRLSHARMCERPDVLAYCLEVLEHSPAGAAALQRGLDTADLVEAADAILAKPERGSSTVRNMKRGIVLSVVTLTPGDPDGEPLVDPTVDTGADGTRRLVNAPAHLSGSEVFSVRTRRYALDFVWMSSGEQARTSSGGVLILPLPGEKDLRLVTFNVGQLAKKVKGDKGRFRCTNAHHAEMQLERFLLAQGDDWQDRLGRIEIVNRSRDDDIKGYSPCASCCDDLAQLPAALRSPDPAQPRRPLTATITWYKPYVAPDTCRVLTTTRTSLDLMVQAKWKLDGPPPIGPP